MNVTIVDTTTSEDMGTIYAIAGPGISLSNSIVWNEGMTQCPPDSIDAVESSLASDESCGSADVAATNPVAGLENNGGPTIARSFALFSHAIDETSPAFDSGDAAGCADGDGGTLAVDQRGEPRPSGDGCDIGAFELQVASP